MDDVAYLEGSDFTPNGELKVLKGKPKVVMVQADYCGHCLNAKPAFKEAHDTINNVEFCTIRGDGGETEKQAMKYVKMNDPQFGGYPTYLVFDKNGKFISTYDGGRDLNSLRKLASEL